VRRTRSIIKMFVGKGRKNRNPQPKGGKVSGKTRLCGEALAENSEKLSEQAKRRGHKQGTFNREEKKKKEIKRGLSASYGSGGNTERQSPRMVALDYS